MRLLTVLLASCLSFTVFAADTAAPEAIAPEAAMPAFTEQLVLDVAITWPESNKPVLEGSTNLPNGTLLAVILEPGVPTGDPTEITVQNGKFSTMLGTEEGLAPGDYSVAVSMLLPMSQPADVIAVIGENGEKIKGNAVTEPMPLSIAAPAK